MLIYPESFQISPNFDFDLKLDRDKYADISVPAKKVAGTLFLLTGFYLRVNSMLRGHNDTPWIKITQSLAPTDCPLRFFAALVVLKQTLPLCKQKLTSNDLVISNSFTYCSHIRFISVNTLNIIP